MEIYSDSARFVLTCNYQHKIIPALRESRCTKLHISKPDIIWFTARAATVLINEDIDFDLDILDSYVRGAYPDLRKCLNQLQLNSQSGKLLSPTSANIQEDQLLSFAAELMKKGDILGARKQVMQHLSTYPTRIEDIYSWMYNNLDLWGNSQEKKDASIVIIRNGLANLSLVGVPEIAVAATMCELTM